jgi:hypothetical protein
MWLSNLIGALLEEANLLDFVFEYPIFENLDAYFEPSLI